MPGACHKTTKNMIPLPILLISVTTILRSQGIVTKAFFLILCHMRHMVKLHGLERNEPSQKFIHFPPFVGSLLALPMDVLILNTYNLDPG